MTSLSYASLNESKKEKDLLEWMDAPAKNDKTKTNAEYFEIDKEQAKEKYEAAQRHKKKTVHHAVGKVVIVQCGKTSMKMGFRQALGYILYELARDLFAEMRDVLAKKKTQAIRLKDELPVRFKRIVTSITSKWREILKQFFQGALSGILSELVVFIINLCVTTVKRTVRIIKEGFLSLVQMIRFALNPPKDISREEVYQQCMKMGMTILITSGGIMLEEGIEKLLLSYVITAPIAFFLAPILAGLLTGLVLALVMYGIDKIDLLGARAKKIDKQICQEVMDELWAMEADLDAVVIG